MARLTCGRAGKTPIGSRDPSCPTDDNFEASDTRAAADITVVVAATAGVEEAIIMAAEADEAEGDL